MENIPKLPVGYKRKSPMASKRKLRVMCELFEKYVDAQIDMVIISKGQIQDTNGGLYRVDIEKNTVQKVYRERYILEDRSDWD